MYMKFEDVQTMYALFLTQKRVTSVDVMRKFNTSKPSAIKMLNYLEAIAIGKSVSRFYILPIKVKDIGSQWNIYQVDEEANIAKIGVLHNTSDGFYFDADYPSFFGDEFDKKIFPGIPWFLNEHRPQGYVGRNIVYNLSKSSGISNDLKSWNDKDIINYAVRFGNDLSGALIVGDDAKEIFLQGRDVDIEESARRKMYPVFAREAISNGVPRSSAAGEQPKFCALIKSTDNTYRNVIVKFTGEMNNDINRRWADLLVCEYIALQVLGKYGFPVAKAELIPSENRMFLEYERIDRVGRYGRRMTSSLTGIDSAFIGVGDGPWAEAMRKASEYFDADEIEMVERIYNFGFAIGNTDMHFGNISFYLPRKPPFKLAPIYDMLPMFYAPLSDNSLRSEALKFIPPSKESKALAKEFWEAVKTHKKVSDAFKKIAEENLKTLS